MVDKSRELILTLGFADDGKHTEETLPKRIYATINSSVFVLNQIFSRYNYLESLVLDYEDWKIKQDGPVEPGKVSIDIGYERRNLIVASAWDIVDWADRLRKVFGGIAGIKKKEKWYSLARDALQEVSDIRNFIQHYDKEIYSFVKGSYPLMGAVFACFPHQGQGFHTRLIVSTPLKSAYHKEVNIFGMPNPQKVRPPVDCIRFSIADNVVDLSELNRKLLEATEELKTELKRRYGFDWPQN